MSLSEKPLDDLTKITGIGEARERWLKQSFNIRTFQDLASLSVAQIEEKIKLDGLIVSRKAIESWLERAAEFSSHAGEVLLPTEETSAELTTGVSNAMPRENGWKPIASFVVEYQTQEAGDQPTEQRTVVHYMEEDRTRNWVGIEGKQLCEWIIDQIPHEFARNQEEQEQPRTQSGGASSAGKSTAVKITQMRIHQASNPTSPVQAVDRGVRFQGTVLRDQPFAFEVNFELVGPKAEEVAERKIGWSAESRTFDPTSRTSPQLCESGPNSFEKGCLKYELSLPEISLKQGVYRIWILITPEQSSIALPDFLDIPKLQVI
jgi:hypothetical protein